MDEQVAKTLGELERKLLELERTLGAIGRAAPTGPGAPSDASAVPEEPEMIAPAWPICLPGGAVKPAM